MWSSQEFDAWMDLRFFLLNFQEWWLYKILPELCVLVDVYIEGNIYIDGVLNQLFTVRYNLPYLQLILFSHYLYVLHMIVEQ